VWATECPLAAIQLEQHGGTKALHPLDHLGSGVSEDGFLRPVLRVKKQELLMRRVERGGHRRLRHLRGASRRASPAGVAEKARARIHVGADLTFLFETTLDGSVSDPRDDARWSSIVRRPTSVTRSTRTMSSSAAMQSRRDPVDRDR